MHGDVVEKMLAGFYALPIEARRECLLQVTPLWANLEAKLLSIGGDRVVPMPDPHLSEILSRGRKFPGKSLSHKLMPSNCHGNVAHLWTKNDPKDFQIVTGWALTKDGLWRQHTWGRFQDTLTIETTVKRSKYYGVILTKEEAKDFVRENDNL